MNNQTPFNKLIGIVTIIICASGCASSATAGSSLGFVYVSWNGTNTTLYQQCLSNSEEKQLVSSDQVKVVDIPRLSSNNQIVFEGDTENYHSIYLVENNQLRSLLPSTILGYTPRWSPDGNQILFNGISAADPTNPDIYIAQLNGDVRKVIDHPSSDYLPEWSPDGASFTFTSTRDGNQEIYLASLKDESVINLTQNAAEDSVALWSPNGRWIAFLSDRTGKRVLYLIDVNNSYAVSPPQESAEEDVLNYQWSPDSSQLAITYGDRSESKIALFTISDKKQVSIADYGGKQSGLAAWSPDGQQLLWMSNTTGNSEIFLSDRQGQQLKQLTHWNGNAMYPLWVHC
jgi:Tol biopolymer transport system component